MTRCCTFAVGGPENGLGVGQLVLAGCAGAHLQLLQHGGTDLLQPDAVQPRLLTNAVHRQRVRRQTLTQRKRGEREKGERAGFERKAI